MSFLEERRLTKESSTANNIQASIHRLRKRKEKRIEESSPQQEVWAKMVPDSIFQHIQQYRMVACGSCAFAAVPQQIDRHLRQHHPQTDEQKRSRIAETGRTLVAVAHSSEEVDYPQGNEEPIAGLEVYTCVRQRDGIWDTEALSSETWLGE